MFLPVNRQDLLRVADPVRKSQLMHAGNIYLKWVYGNKKRLAANVKWGEGFNHSDASSVDSNGHPGSDAASKFAFWSLLERILLKRADCTNNSGWILHQATCFVVLSPQRLNTFICYGKLAFKNNKNEENWREEWQHQVTAKTEL